MAVRKFDEYPHCPQPQQKKYIAAKFAASVRMEKYLRKHCEWNEDRMNYYFKIFPSFVGEGDSRTSVCIAHMLLMKYEFEELKPMEQIAKELKSLSNIAKRHTVLDNLISADYDLTTDCYETFDEFLPYVERLPITREEKWRVVQLYMNFDDCADELTALLSPIVNTIVQILPDYSDFLDECSEEVNEVGLVRYIRSCGIGVPVEGYAYTLRLYLSIMFPHGVTQWVIDETMTHTVTAGAAIPMLIRFNTLNSGETGAVQCLKALSDSTRFDMLCEMCGSVTHVQALADKYSLSIPTIYHHISRLETTGFITAINGKNGHFEYTMNKDNVKAFLDRMYSMLLHVAPR